ncbi:flagellar filament capping protein FliD [Colwellia sp. 1_MG-2023]|uniref:flagellar filament capping protein FliD n=1 Tax=unclassified Colwellia TaxID=196834 RepID=UPI001C093E44|nr:MULTISPECIES: flagellar filament capping protein FliD [unclassified Colwellia]MBU2926099.1 flagellar filament capping protein FliD [Colwellia sp. C2M11]MDO6652480.1 flagellar filament capping protein FliD [Colwellia sp. 3_MG-2023]MDO6665645.1 flagellar filament capping protein FliD [Colwellia sp. 2_MG-2023]MDO6690018.1 flagellar filament capping protein FliD [Colwellia sp. 1_MG-2023]
MSLSALSIDPANLASQYTQIERASKDQLLSNKSYEFSSKISAFDSLKSTLTSFYDSLSDNLDSDSSFLANSATVTDEAALNITTTGSASPGEYDVFVEQLAQAHQVALSFDTTLPLSTNGELNIDLAGDSFSVDLSTLAAGASLSDLASAINSHVDNKGAKASVIRSGTETFLVMTSEESGAANQITISFTPAAIAPDINGGNIASAITGQTELTAAQDSIIKLGATSAITITSSTNTLDTVIEGVTLNLTKVQAAGDSPAHVSVGQDVENTKSNIQGFVDAFNNLSSSITTNDDLKRDNLASSLARSLRNDFQGTFEGKTLYSVGIEFDRSGNLQINSDRLEDALISDPDLLTKMLTGDNGIMSKLEKRIEPYTKSYGLITDKKDTLQASLDIITRQQESHEFSMEQVYQRYLSQFTQMQQTIAQLESTMGQFG